MKTATLSLWVLWIGCGFAVGWWVESSSAREAKEYDRDVLYEEERLPAYDLPPLLVTSEGARVTSPEAWFQERRPQIMALFGNLVYGTVPEPTYPIETTVEGRTVD